ncbi:hypothetical protein A3C26_03705 [Candidatus Daviesbacteria bacterium RIFCSPHIGHO2_02_FULL_39_12]|uniref:AB hydrolase-1 domain-containing protein n=2 Tax=Candidatus Daviesiibacteriota TaxID=1752718 RepID=A0A1F5JCH8_9BACT|nr:MAG: hypothetical protein A3C26_03705 [Candidatus Daviesbacteria bacterium RIFCSPHIGHO2_02_FULL_39_12]OGE71646.1 MAG: hypothetical protein A3H40_01400 [Candidatus Daviesbacteria bacterium RIFCSPLOWO2_02_FULL_38_15]
MYQKIGSQNIYYQKLGKGKNLILLHGWGHDVSSFWGLTDLLKGQFTIWLIDLPGFGRSELPKKAFDTKDYAQILSGFIKKNDIKNSIVLGHSFGGKVAIRLAGHYPKLINKLILIGSSGIKPDPSIKRLLIYPLAKIIHFFVPDIFNLKTQIRKKFYRRIESDYEDAGLMKTSLIRTLNEDLTSDLSHIKAETLIIWGGEDRAVPLKYGKRMYQLIKNSNLVVLEEMGHYLHIHDPERVAYYVKDFS